MAHNRLYAPPLKMSVAGGKADIGAKLKTIDFMTSTALWQRTSQHRSLANRITWTYILGNSMLWARLRKLDLVVPATA